MYVIKKMRLNKFVARPIVSNRELFATNGEKPATIQSKDTADCFDQPSAEGATKTKILGLAQQITAKAYEMRNSNGEAQALNVNAKSV